MSKSNNLTDFLTDLANAIRAKKGKTGAINPQNFSSEIASIKTDPTLQTRSVTPSTLPATYTPGSGYDGIGSITINKHSNLVASNIRKGVNVFGTIGSYDPLSGKVEEYYIEGGDYIELKPDCIYQVYSESTTEGWRIGDNSGSTVVDPYLIYGDINPIYDDSCLLIFIVKNEYISGKSYINLNDTVYSDDTGHGIRCTVQTNNINGNFRLYSSSDTLMSGGLYVVEIYIGGLW